MIKKYWHYLKKNKKEPKFYKKNIIVDYEQFSKDLGNFRKIKNYINLLYDGNLIIIKNFLSEEKINHLKKKLISIEKNRTQSFNKLDKKIPNYWRRITKKKSKKYSLDTDRTSWYFFRWNKSSEYYFKMFDPIWRKVKYLHGFNKKKYEKLLPKDKDHVDRIQVVRYPANSGFIEKHRHPSESLFLIISIYLSQIGKDFKNGGAYYINKKKQKVYVENNISRGDVGIFYSSLYHGVDKSRGIQNNLPKIYKGRWWCGLYSPESDLRKNRLTSTKVR